MNQLSARLLAASIVSALITVGQSRADYMNWTFSTSAVPAGFTADAAGGNNGSATVQLTPYTDQFGATSINALAYQATPAATDPVTFDAANTNYALTMTIKDRTTGDTGNLTFNGSFSGTLSPTSSSLVNTFTNPSQSLTLDGHTYTVTLPSSVALLSTAKTSQQNITASVSVDGAGGSPPSSGNIGSNTPEPASLVLGSLGFSLFGLGNWWQRRRRPKA